MDGAQTTTTRTSPILPRDRVSAGRTMGLFLAAGGLFSLVFGLAVPGFGGHGAVLAISLAVALVVSAAGIWCLRAPARVPVWAIAAAPRRGPRRARDDEPHHPRREHRIAALLPVGRSSSRRASSTSGATSWC